MVDHASKPSRIREGSFRSAFQRWLDRRIPPSAQITLNQRNVFIFPTQTGFVFGGLFVLLILGAINYQASLVYGVAFLLGSMFLVTILYTFRISPALQLELVGARRGSSARTSRFTLRVVRPTGRGREGIQLGWPDGIMQWASSTSRKRTRVSCTCRRTTRAISIPAAC